MVLCGLVIVLWGTLYMYVLYMYMLWSWSSNRYINRQDYCKIIKIIIVVNVNTLYRAHSLITSTKDSVLLHQIWCSVAHGGLYSHVRYMYVTRVSL